MSLLVAEQLAGTNCFEFSGLYLSVFENVLAPNAMILTSDKQSADAPAFYFRVWILCSSRGQAASPTKHAGLAVGAV